jgi:hypothetical protein
MQGLSFPLRPSRVEGIPQLVAAHITGQPIRELKMPLPLLFNLIEVITLSE